MVDNQYNKKSSDNLEMFMQYWRAVGRIPLLILNPDGSVYYCSEKAGGINRTELLEWICLQGEVEHRIFVIEDTFACGVCRDFDNHVCVIGPVAIYEYDLWKKRKFDCSPLAWYGLADQLYKANLSQLKAEAILLYRCLTGLMVSEEEWFDKENTWNLDEEIQEYQFQMVDNEQERNTYKEVADLLDTLRRGDIEEYFRLYDKTLPERTGKLAKTSYKQTEYLTVKIFSLYMHAIIDGGVDYNKAYDLSDIYLQRLERCNDIMQMQNLQKEYVLKCISMIKEEKRKSHGKDIVDEAKSYIQRRRNKKLTVKEVADALNVNASYLSRCFSQKENKTIQQFITQEKIKASCNMLRYSEYSITEIASYLCFSSDSHFCKAFKTITGMTPKQYRQKNYSFSEEYEQKMEG